MIVKILAHAPFFKAKVAPIYHHLDFLLLNNIFKLEVLNLSLTVEIPKCFNQYFQTAVQVHNYPTTFAENSVAVVRLKPGLHEPQLPVERSVTLASSIVAKRHSSTQALQCRSTSLQ